MIEFHRSMSNSLWLLFHKKKKKKIHISKFQQLILGRRGQLPYVVLLAKSQERGTKCDSTKTVMVLS